MKCVFMVVDSSASVKLPADPRVEFSLGLNPENMCGEYKYL